MNYAEEDKNMRYYDDKLKIANKLGYDYVSEAFHKMHESGTRPRQIAEQFGMVKASISLKLTKMKVAKNSPGGRNYFKLTESQVHEIFFNRKPHNKFYMEKLNISDATIRDIRSRRTWRNVTEFN